MLQQEYISQQQSSAAIINQKVYQEESSQLFNHQLVKKDVEQSMTIIESGVADSATNELSHDIQTAHHTPILAQLGREDDHDDYDEVHSPQSTSTNSNILVQQKRLAAAGTFLEHLSIDHESNENADVCNHFKQQNPSNQSISNPFKAKSGLPRQVSSSQSLMSQAQSSLSERGSNCEVDGASTFRLKPISPTGINNNILEKAYTLPEFGQLENWASQMPQSSPKSNWSCKNKRESKRISEPEAYQKIEIQQTDQSSNLAAAEEEGSKLQGRGRKRKQEAIQSQISQERKNSFDDCDLHLLTYRQYTLLMKRRQEEAEAKAKMSYSNQGHEKSNKSSNHPRKVCGSQLKRTAKKSKKLELKRKSSIENDLKELLGCDPNLNSLKSNFGKTSPHSQIKSVTTASRKLSNVKSNPDCDRITLQESQSNINKDQGVTNSYGNSCTKNNKQTQIILGKRSRKISEACSSIEAQNKLKNLQESRKRQKLDSDCSLQGNKGTKKITDSSLSGAIFSKQDAFSFEGKNGITKPCTLIQAASLDSEKQASVFKIPNIPSSQLSKSQSKTPLLSSYMSLGQQSSTLLATDPTSYSQIQINQDQEFLAAKSAEYNSYSIETYIKEYIQLSKKYQNLYYQELLHSRHPLIVVSEQLSEKARERLTAISAEIKRLHGIVGKLQVQNLEELKASYRKRDLKEDLKETNHQYQEQLTQSTNDRTNNCSPISRDHEIASHFESTFSLRATTNSFFSHSGPQISAFKLYNVSQRFPNQQMQVNSNGAMTKNDQ